MSTRSNLSSLVVSNLLSVSLLSATLVGCSGGVRRNERSPPVQSRDAHINTENEQNPEVDAGPIDDLPSDLELPTDSGDEAGDDDDGASPVPPVARLKPGVGVKNFRQIHATMSALTTIPMTQATVAAEYATLTTQLPETNDIRSFSGSHQVAITKLAVEYCDAMVVTPTALNAILPGVNLTQAPSVALDSAGRSAISKALIERFWGIGLSSVPNLEQSLATLSKLIDELLLGKNQNDPNLTPNLVKALCSAVLASGPVTFQ